MGKFDYASHCNTLEDNRKLLRPGNILRILRPYFAFDQSSEAIVLCRGDILMVLKYSETIVEAPVLDRMQVNLSVLHKEQALTMEMFFVENTEDPWKKVYYNNSAVLVPNLNNYFTVFFCPDDADSEF